MAKVSLKNLKKIYDGKVTAVHDFTLDINDKEFIVLVGPSGCGKSTVLRMIAGLEDINAGDLYIGERKVNTVHPKSRDIAMVFQNYALYPHMTVYENMAFALKQKKINKDIIDKKVRHAAEILGITDYLERRPKALSGGQRQRVAIGRAIVREPQVFLMDEPLSNLDAKLRNQMRSELIKLRQRINTTFVYVTHDQTEAMTLGDRIVIMQNGHIQQIGTPHEVFSKPANIFVAGFIGTPQMNFIDAELQCSNEKYSITLCGTQLKLPDFMSSVLSSNKVESKYITVGIRPEYMYLSSESDKNAIQAFVDVTEMMGSEMHIHANANGHSIVLRTPVTKLGNTNLDPGSSIKISTDPEFMQLFSIETGKNLIYS